MKMKLMFAAAVAATALLAQSAMAVTVSSVGVAGWSTSFAEANSPASQIGSYNAPVNGAAYAIPANGAWTGGGDVAGFTTTNGGYVSESGATMTGIGSWISADSGGNVGRGLVTYKYDFGNSLVLGASDILTYDAIMSADNRVFTVALSDGSHSVPLYQDPVYSAAYVGAAPASGDPFYKGFTGSIPVSGFGSGFTSPPLYLLVTVYNETNQDSGGDTSPSGLAFAGVFDAFPGAPTVPLPPAAWGGLSLLALVAGNRIRRSLI